LRDTSANTKAGLAAGGARDLKFARSATHPRSARRRSDLNAPAALLAARTREVGGIAKMLAVASEQELAVPNCRRRLRWCDYAGLKLSF
jgi:hypothetical protein